MIVLNEKETPYLIQDRATWDGMKSDNFAINFIIDLSGTLELFYHPPRDTKLWEKKVTSNFIIIVIIIIVEFWELNWEGSMINLK